MAFMHMLTMFLYSCVQNQHSWQMYFMAMTSVKSWQLSYMALTIHWQYSCTALVSKKSLTTIPYGHQASWQKDALDVSLKNTIDKVTKFYLKQKKSLTKCWCWQSDALPPNHALTLLHSCLRSSKEFTFVVEYFW